MPPSESDLYLLFDRSPIGMYRAREDGRFVYVNPALARLLGYSVAELGEINLNRDVYVDAEERVRLIAEFRPRGIVEGAIVHWKRKDGRRLTVQIWGHVVETETGPSFDASVLDITDIEARNAELRRQRDELGRTATTLDLVVRQMPAIYWVVDHDLRIQRNGGAVMGVLGDAPRDRVGLTLYDTQRDQPASVDPIENHKRALRGETVTYDTEYRGKQLAVTIGPYRSADGEIAGAIGTAIDVTASRALERRMVDAQRAESLGVLAGGLAHDFNNLLVAVIGNADLALREIPNTAPGRSAIENIRDAGLRAAELTDQLLAYAGRGGAGTTSVSPALVVEELLRISAPSLPAQLSVAVDVPGDVVVRADPAQVRQVLLNLIMNARDAIGSRLGKITITARPARHDGAVEVDDVVTATAGTYVMIEVSDDGSGMDSETRRHVFEPFFTTKATGHGLGLAAVLGIVRAHGGGLRLISTLAQGSKVQVLWPAAAHAPVQIPAAPAVAARTVLVIDDEDLVRDVVARMIEDLGYSTVTAADGPAGLAIIERQPIDAVLVDLTMPRMNGAEVIAAVRQRRPTLPIVLCSGYDRDGRGPVQADAFLPKPFRMDALEQTLAKLLPQRG